MVDPRNELPHRYLLQLVDSFGRLYPTDTVYYSYSHDTTLKRNDKISSMTHPKTLKYHKKISPAMCFVPHTLTLHESHQRHRHTPRRRISCIEGGITPPPSKIAHSPFGEIARSPPRRLPWGGGRSCTPIKPSEERFKNFPPNNLYPRTGSKFNSYRRVPPLSVRCPSPTGGWGGAGGEVERQRSTTGGGWAYKRI